MGFLAGAAGWQDGIASPQRQQGIALLVGMPWTIPGSGIIALERAREQGHSRNGNRGKILHAGAIGIR